MWACCVNTTRRDYVSHQQNKSGLSYTAPLWCWAELPGSTRSVSEWLLRVIVGLWCAARASLTHTHTYSARTLVWVQSEDSPSIITPSPSLSIDSGEGVQRKDMSQTGNYNGDILLWKTDSTASCCLATQSTGMCNKRQFWYWVLKKHHDNVTNLRLTHVKRDPSQWHLWAE